MIKIVSIKDAKFLGSDKSTIEESGFLIAI
jgi:hypothetical protein